MALGRTWTGGNMTWKLWIYGFFKGLAEPCATGRLLMILDDLKVEKWKRQAAIRDLLVTFRLWCWILSWPSHQTTVLPHGDCEIWNELFFFCSCATCTSHVHCRSIWVVSNLFHFHPDQSPVWLAHIFQMGWNIQPPTIESFGRNNLLLSVRNRMIISFISEPNEGPVVSS